MKLIGVDGCKAGWIAAISDLGFAQIQFQVFTDLRDIFEEARRGEACVIIDIPIGLTEGNSRQCDIDARRILSRRHKSSVFPAPARCTLTTIDNYEMACQLSRNACGKSLSKQAHGILRKIKEVDDLMDSALQVRSVREAHPEVTFACLAGKPLQHSKKTRDGEAERIDLLSRLGIRFDLIVERLRLGRGNVARDDSIDAAACLATAEAAYRNTLRTFPAVSQFDSRGLRMEIVAPSR